MSLRLKLFRISCALGLAGCLFYGIIYTFTNPELTNTQLTLKLWWLLPVSFSLFWGAGMLDTPGNHYTRYYPGNDKQKQEGD